MLKITTILILSSCLGACVVSGGKREKEQRLAPAMPVRLAEQALVRPHLVQALPSPTPSLLEAAKGLPEASLAPTLLPEGTPSPLWPASLASEPSEGPSPTPRAEASVSAPVVLVALEEGPKGLRAFPMRSADGLMYNCMHDPADAEARWRIAPQGGSTLLGSFALYVQARGEVAASSSLRLGPGALNLSDRLEGPATVRLPLRIPPILDAIASAPSGGRISFWLEAIAEENEAALLGVNGNPLRLEAALDVQ